MHKASEEPSGRSWPALICGLLLMVACSGETPTSPAAQKSDPPSLDQLDACAAGLEGIQAASPDRRANELVAFIPMGEACTKIVMAGCALGSLPTEESASKAGAALIEAHTSACLASYCERLEPRPQLCLDPSMSSTDNPQRVVDVIAQFIAAKLALDLGLPRDEPRIARLARAYASLWASPILLQRIAVSPPRIAPEPEPEPELSFGVTLTNDGQIEIEVRTSGSEPESKLIPALSTPTPNAAPAYDYRALADYARTLSRRFPHASAVHVSAGSTVPMQSLIHAFDTLRGEGCEEPNTDRCLFPQVVMAPSEP